MKPIKQTKVGEDGNCLMACIASLIEVPLEECPDLNEDNWSEVTGKFLLSHGYKGVWMYLPDGLSPKGYCIAGGPGPRGFEHVVIFCDGEMIHDPHPDNTGLMKVEHFLCLFPLTKLKGNYAVT